MNGVMRCVAMAVVAALVCFSGAQSAYAQVTCFGIPAGDPSVCSGHGVCIAPDTCSCYAGYVGLQCQTATCFGIPAGDPAVCSGHGVCMAANTCSCYVGFVGDQCESLTIPTVTARDPGNAPDTRYATPGYGGVGYLYRIGKFEVTAAQYTEFLNAVAKDDTYGLYNTEMWSNTYGCKIQRSGSSPNYSYSVTADWADRPVNYVSWGDAARFANWLHNGQPTGAQDLTTTEDGSYLLNGATTSGPLMAIAREPDATWVIPSEDEWYKAAYHKNDGVTGNYWDYPTGSNALPTAEAPPGTDMVNGSANFFGGAYVDPTHYRTDVGAYDAKPSDSPCGTFDQGGNVWEWNEAVPYGLSRGLRGGSFNYYDDPLHAASRDLVLPTIEIDPVGFRVAEVSPSIPTVSEWGVVTIALLVLAAGALVLARRRVSPVAG